MDLRRANASAWSMYPGTGCRPGRPAVWPDEIFSSFGLDSFVKVPKMRTLFCGNSSVGRAQPCQGWGREFESRFPLQISQSPVLPGFLVSAPGLYFFATALTMLTSWLGGRVVMQRIANPWTPVRFRPQPPFFLRAARVAKLVDAADLKSAGCNRPCRFDSGLGHHPV